MLISSFRKKISSVNSQLSNEINFEILFRNLDRSILRNFAEEFHLWSALIGQSASVYTNIERSVDCIVDVGFRKFISNLKALSFERKIFDIFISK